MEGLNSSSKLGNIGAPVRLKVITQRADFIHLLVNLHYRKRGGQAGNVTIHHPRLNEALRLLYALATVFAILGIVISARPAKYSCPSFIVLKLK